MPLPHEGWGRFGAATGILVVCALWLGWSAGDTPVPPIRPLAQIPWSLPRLRSNDPASDFAAVTARQPWGAGVAMAPRATAKGQSVAATNWRLAGVIRRGADSFALLATGAGGAKLTYLRIGDRLPDGSVLLRITSDSAVTKQGKSPPRIYRLFGAKE